MMDISVHISQLLFHHECVILPNFGGFVCNYKPAYIQTVQHKFHPPSKQISFNKNLVANDGLLTHYVSKKEQVSYDEALKKIEGFVLTLKTKLRTNKEVTIEDIGTFVMDNENRIHFEPSLTENYLLSSYGLTPIQVSPIQRKNYEEKIVEQVKTLPQHKSSVKKWAAAAAIIIPLGFLAFWIPTKYDLSQNINYAKLNPFVEEKAASYSPRTDLTTFEHDDVLSLKESINTAAGDEKYLTFSWLKDEQPITISLTDKYIAEADTTKVVINKTNLRYHIIAGCFSEKKNANKMVKQLKNKGFDAWIVGKRKGLWTVSYNSHSTRQQALDALASAKSDNNKAWMLEM